MISIDTIRKAFASEIVPYWLRCSNSGRQCYAIIWAKSATDALTQFDIYKKRDATDYHIEEVRPAFTAEIEEWSALNSYSNSSVADLLNTPIWQRK